MSKAARDRLPDQKVADVEFDDLGQCRDRLGGRKSEAVAGMNLEAEPPGELGAVTDPLPLGLRGRHPLVGKGVAPRAGMNLDHRRTDGDRRLNLARLGGDEQRNADPGLPQSGDDRGEHLMLAGHVEAAFGCAFFAPLGHETGGVRGGGNSDAHHFLGRRHFEIEGLGEFSLQPRNVVIADVPPIFAQMRRDSVGASFDRDLRRAHGIRVMPAAGVTNGGDVIDIDAEAEVRS
jgi:hypothetical protein